MYSFQAQSPEQLTLREGDIVEVVNSNNNGGDGEDDGDGEAVRGEWWEAELNGKRGLIPGNIMAIL